jgi:hypothetical protein
MAKDKSEFDPRFDAVFQPGYETASAAASPKSQRSTNPAEAALRSATTGERAIVVDGVPERGRNPFLIALVAIGIGLIVAGIAAIRSLAAAFEDLTAQGGIDYFSLDALRVIGPMLVTLGSATLIGVVFMKAIQWNGRADHD